MPDISNEIVSSLSVLQSCDRQRVSDGQTASILGGCAPDRRLLVLVLPQLGDFDSLEYAWWLVTTRGVRFYDRRLQAFQNRSKL